MIRDTPLMMLLHHKNKLNCIKFIKIRTNWDEKNRGTKLIFCYENRNR